MAWHNSFSQFLSNTLEHTKASFWNSVFQEALDNDNYLKESKLDTTKVVNTSDAVATDVKALNAVHANPNVEGTMAKQIANNTQQINDLNGKFSQPTITLYGGWVANDSTPYTVKNGTNLTVYARIKDGSTEPGIKIANVAVVTGLMNQFFTIVDTLTGANLGQAYLMPNGDIYTLTALTTGDYLIKESFIVLY